MYQGYGTVIKGVGGLFTVRLHSAHSASRPPELPPQPLDGGTVSARARGILRRRGALLVGDFVRVLYDDASFTIGQDGIAIPAPDGAGIVVEEILPRRCALIRPPMANLDVLFVTAAATSPEPDTETLDKLLCIAEFNRVSPVIVITKCDLSKESADRLAEIYRTAGFPVFCVTGTTGEGVEALRTYINENTDGRIAAFSGASGVGKSTLLNQIFPSLHLETGDVSHKIERGKNTTRTVELYPLSESDGCGYLADTPGFTMLDFERFDFFAKEDLLETFREFRPHAGDCRYKKCSHTKEEGCAILAAVQDGAIPPSRHQSYLRLYEILKAKNSWGRG